MNFIAKAFLTPLCRPNFIQIANLSKYISKTRAKHLPLNTKRVGKGYKKGYGARTEGKMTSRGNWNLFLNYSCLL
jgi:hypothetical protein